MVSPKRGTRAIGGIARRMGGVLLALAAAAVTACGGSGTAGAQTRGEHPRLLVTPTIVADLKARSGDADLAAVISAADRIVTNGLDPGYQGEGLSSSIPILGLAYLVTGDMKYVGPINMMLDELNSAAAAGDITALTVDSTFGSRSTAFALAIAYDWAFPALTDARRAATIRTVNAYFDHFQTGERVGDRNGPAYGNYFGGHVLGFGAMGYATDVENARAPEIISTIRALFDTNVPPSFVTGPSLGGFPVEGYVYGTNTFVRLFQYIRIVETATGEVIGNTGNWANQILVTLFQALKPNLWQLSDEGEYTGDSTGFLNPNQLQVFTSLADDPVVRGHGAWLLANHNVAPEGQFQSVAPLTRIIFRVSDAPVDYRPTSPTYRKAEGAALLFMRSSWADNAVWASFAAGIKRWTDHVGRQAAHFTIQRGSDYLLVNGTQWKQLKVFTNNTLSGFSGPGYTGNTFVYPASEWENTLYADDGSGAYLLDGTNYAGGQAGFSDNQPYLSSQRLDSTYIKFDATRAYANNHPEDYEQRAVRLFVRNFAFFGPGNFVVFDRVRVLNTSINYHLRFYFNSNAPPVITAGIASSTSGSSKLFMRPLLPEGARMNTAWQQLDGINFVPRVEVRPPSATTDFDALTVFTAAGSEFPDQPDCRVVRSEDGSMVGAQILEPQRERVALFAAAETGRVAGTVAYPVVTAAAGGRHYLFDLMPNSPYAAAATATADGVRVVVTPGTGDLTSDAVGALAFDLAGTTITPLPADGPPPLIEDERPAPSARELPAAGGGCGCRTSEGPGAALPALLLALALVGIGRGRRA